ncbi:hypothetical protein [Streptosporangium minutum]|nr:hypothetical protein [Streptosporangium minutum]
MCTLVRHLEAMAIDDVLDLFALLMSTKLINLVFGVFGVFGVFDDDGV